MQELLANPYEKYRSHQDGEFATYIPELGKADPNSFGICVATVDGQVFEMGGCDQNFTIQSISKPLVFGMALEQCGREETFKRVGVEPSGDAFNSIILDDKSKRPYNAMVNSGAIATSALIEEHSQTAPLEYLLKKLSAQPVALYLLTNRFLSPNAERGIVTAPSVT